MDPTSILIPIEWVTRESFAPFGEVIEMPSSEQQGDQHHPTTTTTATTTTLANQGTAQKYHRLANVVNLRPPTSATPNLCIFHCQPRNHSTNDDDKHEFHVKILERHPHSSQIFLPMVQQREQQPLQKGLRYLVIVAEGDPHTDTPDRSTLRAFMFHGWQGVSYRAGCWHHPMIALDSPTTFAVLVHEDGTSEDCHEHHFSSSSSGDDDGDEEGARYVVVIPNAQ